MVAPIKPVGPIKPVLAPAGQSTAPVDPNAKPAIAGQPGAQPPQTAQPKPGEKVFNITTDKDPAGEFTKVFAKDEQHAQQVYQQQGTAAGQFKGAEIAQESIDEMVKLLAKNGIEEGRDYYVNGTIYTDNQVMAEDITDVINLQAWDKKRAVSRKHADSDEYYVDLEGPNAKLAGKAKNAKFKKSLNICREVLSSKTATSEQKMQAKRYMDSIKKDLGTIVADIDPVSESTNTMTDKVHFNIDSERAYQQVMDKFGHAIEWAGDTMVVDRKMWSSIEELALAAGGSAEEEYGTQGVDVEEAAPALVRGAAGLALGSIAAAGTPALMGILGPVLGIAVGATGAYNAAKMGMNSADAIWDWAAKKLGGGDNAEEFAMTHINAALRGEQSFEYNGKTYKVNATPQQAKAAGIELRKVAENITAPIIDEAKNDTIEAYGARGMKNTPWRRSFKNLDALNKWAEENDAEVMGTRDLEQAKRGNLSPAVEVEEADCSCEANDDRTQVDEVSNDYFKRRKDEEDRIAGTKAPAKRTPRQTDYEKKRKEQKVDEAGEDAFVSALKGLQQWDVIIMNNFYSGKYPDYSARQYSVVASSPEEARQVVLNNADYVLKDLLSRKLQNGKRVLPANSALPIEDKRVGDVARIKPGSITTMGYKKMLTPDGVKSMKFASGKIVDVEGEQGVAEAKHGLNKRVRIVSGPADCVGKIGTVGEVRPGLHAGAEKTYTVDYDYDGNTGRSKSVQLKAKDLRLVKDDITESIMDKKSTMTEGEKVKTKTGMIHKGTYGSEVDVNDDGAKKKKATPKSATGKRGRPAKADEPKTSKSNDLFGRVPDKAPKGKKGTVVKGKATKDDNLEEARETLKTAKGTIYKGGTYGTSYDVGDNVKKAPAKKNPTGQRGRPKKEVGFDDAVAKGTKDLQGMFGSKAPKKGSALDKLPKTKHKIKDSNVEEGLAQIRGLKKQITETIRQVQRLPMDKQNDQRVIDIVARLEETVSKAVGNVLRESHETMAHILSRFPAEVKQFAAGGELDDGELYDALYDYYSMHGEMPYGIAKARTGDPLEWVSTRFAQDIGDHYKTESVMDEASGAHMFMTGEIVYFDNRRGKVDRQEGNKVFVHTDNGEMDVFPADQTSLTRQGMIPTMKKNLGQIGRGIKGFMTGKQEESIEEADDDITVFEKEHSREELDAMSDAELADLASSEYSAEDMLQYDEQGALANRGEIIDVIVSYNADNEVDEGNQFSGALQKAKSSGQEEFEVGGKTYKVKEATPAPMADMALESLATMIRLAGLPKR